MRTSLLTQHLRLTLRSSPIVCTRHASTNIKVSEVLRRLNKYNPFSWLYRFFTPGYMKNIELSPKEKKRAQTHFKGQIIIFPGLLTLLGIVFYSEWKERIELLEEREIHYDRRLEISVDRFKAARGVAPWDKKKYAKWSEEDKASSTQTDGSDGVSFLGGIDSLFPASASSDSVPSVQRDNEVLKEKKKSITRELCEIGDKDSTPTLLGQLKGK